MSTKIYSGFKIDTTNLFQIRTMVDSIRPWVQEQQDRVFMAWYTGARDGHPELEPLDLVDKFIALQKDVRRTQERNFVVDTDFDIVFIPSKRATYGMTFVERVPWHTKWMGVEGVIDFAYWDNTDQPEHLTNWQWQQRGLRWASLLPGYTAPADVGFTIRVNNEGPDIYGLMYAEEDRRKALAEADAKRKTRIKT